MRNYLQSQHQEEAILLGRRLLDSALGEQKLDDIAPEQVDLVLEEQNLSSLLELLVEIGSGNIMSVLVGKRLLQAEEGLENIAQQAKASDHRY